MSFVVKSYAAGAQVLRKGNSYVVSCTRCGRSGLPISDYSDAEYAALQHAANGDGRGNCLPL
jgi:hypothetical protein